MNTAEFLGRIRGLGVTLRIDRGVVRCSAPKGILTQGLQEEIARRKTEIVAIIGQEEKSDPVPEPLLGPMSRPNRLPLSFAQQRLWFLNQLDPGNAAYTIAGRWLLSGALDIQALEAAIAELVRRHESLRTTFPSDNGEPVQRIGDPEPIKLRIVDLEHGPQTDREGLAQEAAHREAQQPFDLARGPLFRPVLLHHGRGELELIASLHHIIADGWSLAIIVQEIRTLYQACSSGGPSPLPPLVLQYADYVLWQRRWLSDQVLQEELRYWRDHLRERPAPLELRADYRRSTQPSSAAHSYEFEFPNALTEALRALGARSGATLFMTLLAGFAALLARYTGEMDIVLGTPVANRNRVELEPVIGFFANTLVLRINLAGDPKFPQILDRVREEVLNAHAHQHIPFEKLVEELHPERKPGRNPLFDISFVFESSTGGRHTTAVSRPKFVTVAAPFDLTIFVLEGPDGGVRGRIVYKRDLFAPETIADLVRHYQTLLQGVTVDPLRQLSGLPLLDDSELRRLLFEWNATATDYPRHRSLHGLFEDQVRAAANAVAVVSGETALTYGELDMLANRLAHQLRASGVQPQERVGVWLERSIEMIVAILGILKAGGAYAPLDLKATPERLAFMLTDANVRVLLTQERMLPRLPPHDIRLICLDTLAGQLDAFPDTRPPDSVRADSLAYVMYTSGSTGEPKGVAVTHRNVVRLVKATDYAHFGPDEVFLQFAPLSFDASTFEIWGALLNGGRLVIAPPGALSIHELGTELARHGVTTLWLTAGLFHEIVQHQVEVLGPLRQLLSGGDVLSPSHVRRMREKFPACRLINGYGPTEATTFSCHYTIPADTGDCELSVPIGRPVANTRVYVLDGQLNPVPVGVPGELWIAGDGLARGYLNREALTSERFIVHRLAEGLEERLYRSGDIVRWLASGVLEFIGRRDDQVKIRGYRVEPGEIEAALAQHARVREAAVVAREAPGADEPRLIAYVVLEGTASTRNIREYLRRKLPEYMIPAAFVALDRMPLTPNGKVDRRALPDPAGLGGREDVTYLQRSHTAVERQLIEIWEEVLGVRPVGTRDDFFDLGGHSLLAVRLFARLEQCMGIRLPLSTLFETPTIEALAAVIQAGRAPRAWCSLVPINSSGDKLPVFAVPGVGGNVLCYSELARLMGAEQPFYALQSRGLSGTEDPLTRIEDIAAAFLKEIRAVQPTGPYQLLGSCMGGIVAYEMAQQMRMAGEEVRLLVLLETWAPPGQARLRLQPSARARAALHIIASRCRLYVKTFADLRGRRRVEYLLDRLKMLRQMLAQRDVFRGDRSELHLQTVVQANLGAFAQYKPSLYTGRVVLFYASEKDLMPNDPRLAWRNWISGDLEIRSVPGGDSGQMLREPHVGTLARHVMACIELANLERA